MNISLRAEVYAWLSAQRRPGESFSDALLRLLLERESGGTIQTDTPIRVSAATLLLLERGVRTQDCTHDELIAGLLRGRR